MCPYNLRDELVRRFKVFYNRVNGTKLEGIIPFSIDYTSVYTGIPRPAYIPGKRSEPPIKALHFHVVREHKPLVQKFLLEVYSPTVTKYPLNYKFCPITCLFRKLEKKSLQVHRQDRPTH